MLLETPVPFTEEPIVIDPEDMAETVIVVPDISAVNDEAVDPPHGPEPQPAKVVVEEIPGWNSYFTETLDPPPDPVDVAVPEVITEYAFALITFDTIRFLFM